MIEQTPPPSKRAGEHNRSNPDRYFHVMSQGWFIFTREGIRGPFVDRFKAQNYLRTHIEDQNDDSDPSSSWRL